MASELYYYAPSTPPPSVTVQQVPSAGTGHSRTTSGSSVYTNESTPESAGTNITTPNRSPALRQHGPALLPKIRPQDVVVEPVSRSGPCRHRRALSSTLNPPGFAPYPASRRHSAQRPVVDPADCYSLASPLSAAEAAPAGGAAAGGSYLGSALTSPVTPGPAASQSQSQPHRARAASHARSASTTAIDEAITNRYGSFPAYSQPPPPRYVSDCSPITPVTPASAVSWRYPTYQRPANDPSTSTAYQPSSVSNAQSHGFSESTARTLGTTTTTSSSSADYLASDTPTTTILRYLTAPTQPVHLVRNLACPGGRSSQHHFWWDIRNLRRWSSFSLATVNSIPNFTKLLTTEISKQLVPSTLVDPSRLAPDSERGLANVIRDIYAPRVNAALRISQGPNCLSLYPAPDAASNQENGPHFLANYASDSERTPDGSPRGRVIGLVKSFDRWNTGMRNEQPHRRVEYLNGLAHLQKCMRENSCRYGFIMTEIELVCVRAGCDEGHDVPYFGYLELATPIATKTSSSAHVPSANNNNATSAEMSRNHSSASAQSSDYSSSSRGGSPANNNNNNPSSTLSSSASPPELSGPFTATLALYYLLMLAKSVPLPSQPSFHLNVGGPGALTRQRILSEGKDKWIPEPQQRERRDAKRIRGWIWPQDAWHRREGGGVSRAANKSSNKSQAPKRWHK